MFKLIVIGIIVRVGPIVLMQVMMENVRPKSRVGNLPISLGSASPAFLKMENVDALCKRVSMTANQEMITVIFLTRNVFPKRREGKLALIIMSALAALHTATRVDVSLILVTMAARMAISVIFVMDSV
jgi:hypothetical protein